MSTSVTPSAPPNGATQPLTQAGLTPQQEAQWNDTVSMMAWVAPGFRHIWYRLLSTTHNAGGAKHTAVFTRDVPIAATDAKNVLINPDTFFKLGLPQRVYVMGHEILHNVYGDVELLHRCVNSGKVLLPDGSTIPFNNDTMQKAMDARINALLDESKIGRRADKLDGKDCGHFDPEVKGNDSVYDVYKKYYEEKPEGEGDQSMGTNPGGFDNVMKPGQSTGQNPGQAAGQRNQQQWGVELKAAQTIENMRSQGKMAASLKRMFESILEPEISWIDYIETIIKRAVGGGSFNWKQPDEWYTPRDFFQPRKTGKGAGWIVVWGDTSGSRSDSELASNMAELAGLLEDVNPKRLTVLWCDAAIDFVDEITDPADLAHVAARGTGGGGGTSMEPVMDWIKDSHDTPDLFIGFTDGYVSFPEHEPRFPVIWASSTDHVYPWGQVVRVNKIARGQ